jgi:hypothetical protein
MSSTKSDVEKFNLKQLDAVEVKEQNQVKITNRFTSLENFKTWLMIWTSIRLGKFLDKM